MTKKIAVGAAAVLLLFGGLVLDSIIVRDDNESRDDEPESVAMDVPVDSAGTATLEGLGATTDAARASASRPEHRFRGVVVDEAGRPVRGVVVDARVYWNRDGPRWSILEGGKSLHRAETGVDGMFSFPDLPTDQGASALDVACRAGGHLPARARIEPGVEGRVTLSRGGRLRVTVEGPDGAPVAGAGLGVRGDDPTSSARLSQMPIDARSGVATDAAGVGALFLPPGRFVVVARATGYAPCRSDRVAIAKGRTEDLVLRLDRGLRVDVRVRGPDGEPVVGADVLLLGPEESGASGTSGDDGNCSLSGIARPRYPTAEGYRWRADLGFRVTAEGHALHRGSYRIARDSERVELDVALVRGVPVSLRIVDDLSEPIEGATARIDPVPAWGPRHRPERAGRPSDARGRLELPRLARGTHGVEIAPPGLRNKPTRVVLVVGSESVERDVVLPRTSGSLSGHVLLPDGTPASRARVALVEIDAQLGRKLGASGRDVEADGAFAFRYIVPKRYALVASVPGFLAQWQEVDVVEGGAAPVTFRVDAGGVVSGMVKSTQGEALAGAEVFLRTTIVNTNGSQQQIHVPVTRTGADGRFEIRGVGDRTLRIAAVREGFVEASPWPGELEAGDTDVVAVMKPATEGAGMPLQLRVTTAGRPHDGTLSAQARATGGEGAWQGLMRPTKLEPGLFELRVIGQEPGLYDLRVRGAGTASADVRGVRLSHAQADGPIAVELPPGAVLSVRVLDADGEPMAEHWFDYYMRQVQTDEDGVLSIGGLEPGVLQSVYLIDHEDPKYSYVIAREVEAPGAIDVTMRRCGYVEVEVPAPDRPLTEDVHFRLRDAAGAVVDEQIVTAERARTSTGSLRRTLRCFGDGVYVAEAVHGSTWRQAEVSARVGQRVEVTVR